MGVSEEVGVAPHDEEDKPLDRVAGKSENAIAEVVVNGRAKLTRVGGKVGNDFHASASPISRAEKLKRCMSADGDIDLAALRAAAVRAKWRRKHEQLLLKIES